MVDETDSNIGAIPRGQTLHYLLADTEQNQIEKVKENGIELRSEYIREKPLV